MAKRRANGEGSIYQRSDGRWEGYVPLPNLERKFFTGQTYAAVKAKVDAFRKLLDEGAPAKFERKKFSLYMADWLEGNRRRLKDQTWERYEELIRLHATPEIGNLNLDKITAAHIKRIYSKMTDKGLSETTKMQLHAVLRSAFKQAVLSQLLHRNIMDTLERPKREEKEMRTFSPEQARRFIAAARGDKLEALYVLAITTGMRQGELLALCWDDVDLETGNIRVQRSLQRTKNEGFKLGTPKTKRSRRQIKLTAFGHEALERHRVNQTAERLLKNDYWQGQNLIFTNTRGGPLESSHVLRHCFYPLLIRAGLPRIRFHDLRHTAATLMLGQGVHPKIVAEMLGHSTITITLDLYSHVTPTMQRAAVQAMDTLLLSMPRVD